MRRKHTPEGFPPFPNTLSEFQRRFATEDACANYLVKVRWPEGFRCPSCHHAQGWRISVRSHRCAGCRKEIHLTAGTVLHGSHLPLRHWFWAVYLMGTFKPGISALQLQQQLGIGSYRSALYLCRRLRAAMVNPAREPLKGVVEVDITYVGGEILGKRWRWALNKAPVIVAVENRGDHTGRIRMQAIETTGHYETFPFIAQNVTPGSQINTDGGAEFEGLNKQGYDHRPRIQKKPSRAGKLLPWVHKVISNLKTWLLGTHHGVTPEYLQGYLDEFTFRYNRRAYWDAAFLSLLLFTTRIKPLRRSTPK